MPVWRPVDDGKDDSGSLPGQDFNTARLKRINDITLRYGLGPTQRCRCCADRGIPVTRIGKGSIIQLGYGKYHKKMEGTLSDNTSCISVDMACDKTVTRSFIKLELKR